MSRRVGVSIYRKGCGGEMVFYAIGEVTDVWLVMNFASSDWVASLDSFKCQCVCLSEREAALATLEFPNAFVIPCKQYRRQGLVPSHNLGMSANDLMPDDLQSSVSSNIPI